MKDAYRKFHRALRNAEREEGQWLPGHQARTLLALLREPAITALLPRKTRNAITALRFSGNPGEPATAADVAVAAALGGGEYATAWRAGYASATGAYAPEALYVASVMEAAAAADVRLPAAAAAYQAYRAR